MVLVEQIRQCGTTRVLSDLDMKLHVITLHREREVSIRIARRLTIEQSVNVLGHAIQFPTLLESRSFRNEPGGLAL